MDAEPAQTRPPSTESDPLGQTAERLPEWPEILQVVRGFSPSVAAAFNGSTAYVSGGYVLIDAPNEIAFQLLRRPEQRDSMRKAIQQITGRFFKLGPYKKPDSESDADPLAQLALDAEKEGIPVIQK